MGMPRRLQVGGRRYTIIRDPNAVKHHIKDHLSDGAKPPICEKNNLPGKYDISGIHLPASKRIYISPKLSEYDARETLCHELLHALWDYTGCTEPSRLANYEERVVTSLAPILFDVLQSNPALVNYLADCEEED